MKLQSKHIMIPILALFLAVFAAGCSKGQNKDVSISLTALDGADPASSDALFPRFVTKDEATQKKLDKLNKEVDRIQKEYRQGLHRPYLCERRKEDSPVHHSVV